MSEEDIRHQQLHLLEHTVELVEDHRAQQVGDFRAHMQLLARNNAHHMMLVNRLLNENDALKRENEQLRIQVRMQQHYQSMYAPPPMRVQGPVYFRAPPPQPPAPVQNPVHLRGPQPPVCVHPPPCGQGQCARTTQEQHTVGVKQTGNDPKRKNAKTDSGVQTENAKTDKVCAESDNGANSDEIATKKLKK